MSFTTTFAPETQTETIFELRTIAPTTKCSHGGCPVPATNARFNAASTDNRVSFEAIEPITEQTSSGTPVVTSTMLRAVLTVLQLSTVNFFASFTNGVITVGLPTIAASIDLPRTLYLWPTSVYGLTCGATLLIAGSVADLVGARKVELTGCVLSGAFILASGCARTGTQLVVFRALQGIAMSMHLPSSVGLVAKAVPTGKARNIGFSCLGLSQPLGFSVGLVVGGVMIEKTGWRAAFYLSGAATLFTAVAGFWSLPNAASVLEGSLLRSLWTNIDWVGGGIASAGLAMLSYTLATLSGATSNIRELSTIALLTLGVTLIASFPIWMHFQQRRGKPALIPNALWKKVPFTSTCIMIAISWGVTDSMELFSSLYFQEVQDYSPIAASLYLLPNLVVGTCIELSTGLLVDKLPARWLVTAACFLTAGSPLLMANINPAWSYWHGEFWAQILAPLCGDVLFTVGLIIVTDIFPEETQALAGAVFSTLAQFGMSFGVGVMQLIALSVAGSDSSDEKALLRGYRASFWGTFSFCVICGLIAVGGLRKAGKVGVKQD